jgi:hypothetical protein
VRERIETAGSLGRRDASATSSVSAGSSNAIEGSGCVSRLPAHCAPSLEQPAARPDPRWGHPHRTKTRTQARRRMRTRRIPTSTPTRTHSPGKARRRVALRVLAGRGLIASRGVREARRPRARLMGRVGALCAVAGAGDGVFRPFEIAPSRTRLGFGTWRVYVPNSARVADRDLRALGGRIADRRILDRRRRGRRLGAGGCGGLGLDLGHAPTCPVSAPTNHAARRDTRREGAVVWRARDAGTAARGRRTPCSPADRMGRDRVTRAAGAHRGRAQLGCRT